MVARLTLVAVGCSILASTAAFSPAMPFNSIKAAGAGRGSFSVPRPTKTHPALGLRMTEGSKDAASTREIDFSKVGFNVGSESGFSGMIFRPEDSEEPESRCRVDWDVKCEKVRGLSEILFFSYATMTLLLVGTE